MRKLPSDTALWLERHVLPREPALRAWLRRKRVVDLEVDDIVQQTYAILAARTDLAQVRHPQAYVYQVAYSVILKHVRRSKVVSIRVVEDFDRLEAIMPTPNPEDEVIARDELQRLADMIDDMPHHTRRVFVLSKVEGLSQRDVARRTGLSESTVEKHISKGVRILMDRFGRSGKVDLRASNPAERGSRRIDEKAREQSDD
nr:RNA polymerase sigma factor [uncultured Brevundimonas sp.]